jgi:hypothetical protein
MVFRPFVVSGDAWSWRIQSESDLTGATINYAEAKDLGSGGLTIAPMGERPMSLITPPLHLTSSTSRILRVDLGPLPAGSRMRDLRLVRLLWQTEASPEYKFQEVSAGIDQSLNQIYFSLPANPQAIHRLGVQFPDLNQPITIQGMELARLPFFDRIKLFFRQFTELESWRSHPINYATGPLMLGQGLNYYLLGFAVLGVSGYAFLKYKRGDRPQRHVVVCIILVAWVIGDLKATANVATSVFEERSLYADQSRLQQITLSEGAEIAWAYQQLLTLTPAQSRFAVLSDETFGPAQRLAYLLAPLNYRVENYADADFIVVLHASDAEYKRQEHLFTWRKGPAVTANVISAKSDGVYLLRRSKS